MVSLLASHAQDYLFSYDPQGTLANGGNSDYTFKTRERGTQGIMSGAFTPHPII